MSPSRLFVPVLCALVLATMSGRHGWAASRVPVVFVPGFLGSQLEDSEGVLWGGGLMTIAERVRDLEYKAKSGAQAARATGPVDSISLLWPFEIQGYGRFMSFLESIGYAEGRDLFTFTYDWRQSNLVSAQELARFVASKPALAGRRFNLVAHSMGGIVASLYIFRHGGDARVANYVSIATPYLGSAKILANMLGDLHGDASILHWILKTDLFLRILLSFPSVYEQLPMYRPACRVTATDPPHNCDVLSDAFWSDVIKSRKGRKLFPARLPEYIDNARQIHATICRPIPKPIRVFRFAGTKIRTIGEVIVKALSEPPSDLRYLDGDGSVSEYSASCGDPRDVEIVFDNHMGVLDHEIVQHRLKTILLTDPGARHDVVTFRDVDNALRLAAMPRAAFDIESKYLRPGQDLVARVRLETADGKPVSNQSISAKIVGPAMRSRGEAVPFVEEQPGRYVARLRPGVDPGIYGLKVRIPRSGELYEAFAVIER